MQTLQRTAGNRAVAAMVQRTEPAEDAQTGRGARIASEYEEKLRSSNALKFSRYAGQNKKTAVYLALSSPQGQTYYRAMSSSEFAYLRDHNAVQKLEHYGGISPVREYAEKYMGNEEVTHLVEFFYSTGTPHDPTGEHPATDGIPGLAKLSNVAAKTESAVTIKKRMVDSGLTINEEKLQKQIGAVTPSLGLGEKSTPVAPNAKRTFRLNFNDYLRAKLITWRLVEYRCPAREVRP
ncbi:hypothetical protein [Streptomyces sp. Tu6071]|uniref:hypothetical protein n=1 Tax=Streptomyces sp. Tu6071 TaxID=355249 RepID=UPI0005B80DF7|nr:hypothetical protein [Streptomyces sp. Tu6071]